MTLRRWLTVVVATLSLALAPAAARALWSATADGQTSVAAATMANAGAFTAACTTAAADSTVTLTWTPSPDSYVDGYEIVRTASPGGAQTTVTAGSGSTTAVDTPLVGDGRSYGYAVRATAGAWRTSLLAAPAAPAYTLADCSPAPAAAPAPHLLLSAASFSVLGGTGGVTSTGSTSVSGDLGVSAGQTVVGLTAGQVSGTVHLGDAVATQAHADRAAAYSSLDGRAATTEFAGDLDGRTFLPGVHHTGAALALTGTVALDAQGDAGAVFVFQVDGALGAAAASTVLLAGGAQASHVYWQVEAAADLGAGAQLSGTLLAAGAITLGQDALLVGRALSAGAVTLAGNQVRFTSALPPTVTIIGGAEALTNDTTPTLVGSTSAATGTAVTVTVGQQTLTTVVGEDGTWSVTATELVAGTHTVTATVRDAAGNAGKATQALTVEAAPEPVLLASAASFTVLAGTGGVTNTGDSSISGDVGVSDDQPLVGLTEAMVSGAIRSGGPVVVQAHADRAAAYAELDARVPTREFSGDLDGRTFRHGVHHTAAALALSGTLTLDAEGDPAAVFVIQVDAALDTAASSRVVLAGGALSANVFWQVQGAAGLGATSAFVGTVLANGAVTVGNGARLAGRALSAGSVTLSGNSLG